MSIIEGILKEEIDRLHKSIKLYEKMLSELPKGTIFIRKMGNSSFVYRKWKENGFVISEYIGKLETEKSNQEIAKSKEYKRIDLNLRMASNELLKLEKAYRVYDRK